MAATIHNHKAGRDYFLLDRLEAGIELKAGGQVAAARAASIDDAFARVNAARSGFTTPTSPPTNSATVTTLIHSVRAAAAPQEGD